MCKPQDEEQIYYTTLKIYNITGSAVAGQICFDQESQDPIRKRKLINGQHGAQLSCRSWVKTNLTKGYIFREFVCSPQVSCKPKTNMQINWLPMKFDLVCCSRIQFVSINWEQGLMHPMTIFVQSCRIGWCYIRKTNKIYGKKYIYIFTSNCSNNHKTQKAPLVEETIVWCGKLAQGTQDKGHLCNNVQIGITHK